MFDMIVSLVQPQDVVSFTPYGYLCCVALCVAFFALTGWFVISLFRWR